MPLMVKQKFSVRRLALPVGMAGLWVAAIASTGAQELDARGAEDAAVVEVLEEVQDEVDAVEEIDGEAQVMGNPWGVETGQLIGAKQFQLKQIFQVEVEQLQRICELDANQIRKLRIGAKGAVKKLTAAWTKQMAQQMGQFGEPGQPAKDQPEAPVAVEFEDADEIDENVIQMMTMNGLAGNPYKSDDPAASRFWTKTVSSVLADTQLETLKKYKLDRERAKRTALVDYALSTMTLELALTSEQAVKLDAIIRPVLMDAEMDCIALYEPYLIYYYASKSNNANIAKLLSPSQLQKWKIFMAPMKQIGQVMEMEDADFEIVIENTTIVFMIAETLDAIAQEINAWLESIFE